MREAAFPLLLDGPALLGGVPPAWPFFAGALLVTLLRGQGQGLLPRAVMLATPIVGLVNLLTITPGTSFTLDVLDLQLVQLRADRLSLLFGLLFHIGAFLGAIYALRAPSQKRTHTVAPLVPTTSSRFGRPRDLMRTLAD